MNPCSRSSHNARSYEVPQHTNMNAVPGARAQGMHVPGVRVTGGNVPVGSARVSNVPVGNARVPYAARTVYQMPARPQIHSYGMASQPYRNVAQMQTSERVNQVRVALDAFVRDCNSVIFDLNTAHTTEWWDAQTSNDSLFGSIIASRSHALNNSVSHRVDSLRHRAVIINQELSAIGIFGQALLSCGHLNGQAIREAEAAEHHFLANLISPNLYGPHASRNTMRVISETISKVGYVQSQAKNLLRLNLFPHLFHKNY